MSNSIQEATRLGHAIWLDYVQRGMFRSGEFQQYLDMGVTGVTSNPTIFEKAINESHDYDEALLKLAKMGKSTEDIYEALAVDDIGKAADMMRPLYDQSDGLHGFVSIEVSPALAFDTERTVANARWLFALLGRPNILIKVPATREGIPAIRQLISEGINVNATLIFSLDYYQKVMAAYIDGLERLIPNVRDIHKVASVASFFVSRVDTAVDALLEEKARAGDASAKALLGKTAVANAKLSYAAFLETFGNKRFTALKQKGARVQRPVWASTGTKNPAYSDVLYVEPLIGADSANTMPPATIKAFLDHGKAQSCVMDEVEESKRTMEALAKAGINLNAITDKLLSDGVKSFASSFDKLLAGIAGKKQQLLSG